MKKLAIICTHPIQYYSPVFKMLHERQNINIHVFYTRGNNHQKNYDPGFKQDINWDVPLLEGYDFTWLNNVSKDAGTHYFKGIKNPELISSIKKYEPDAVLIFGWAYQSHLKAMCYFKGKIPVFFRGDSTLLDEKPGVKTAIRRLFLKWVYSHVDCAFFVGKNNEAYFKKHGLKNHQLVFAPHAVDNARFAADQSLQAKKIRAKMGIAENDTVLLFAGKFEPKKDPLLLLEMFMQLNRKDVHLVFAGDGVLKDELQAKSQQLKNTIHFLPFQNQSQMPALYQACDVFCLPSKGPGETWGLAVNEAMACGKAVVVSDKTGCAANLVENGSNGYIFLSKNKKSLNETLSRFFSDKERVKKMGLKSADLIREFSFSRITDAVEGTVQRWI